jgi:SAM-dependent MidA family methyltransferase
LNKLSEKIRDEIAVHGAIPFARFMEMALYCPDTGFYETDDDTVGRRGDFYTSVSVGSVFGELLAFQFAEWMVQCPVGPKTTGWQRIS